MVEKQNNNLLDKNKFQNSFVKFRNSYAYVMRFIRNARGSNINRNVGVLSNDKNPVRVQNYYLSYYQNNDLQCLQPGIQVKCNSNIKLLHPFLDDGR